MFTENTYGRFFEYKSNSRSTETETSENSKLNYSKRKKAVDGEQECGDILTTPS